MNLIEFAEKTYQVPLTQFQKHFLAEYEKARNNGKAVFITFPMHLSYIQTMEEIKNDRIRI